MSLLLKLGLVLAVGYVLIVAILYYTQTGLLFPESLARRYGMPEPAGAEVLKLQSGDGDELTGLLFRADRPGAALVIGFGGNAQNAQELAVYLADVMPPGHHVAVFHYRGYYPSGGTPCERALLADSLLIHDTLVERLQPSATYGVGFSLGSSVAAYLSSRRPLAGLVLVTPFDSIVALARMHYFWVPVGLLLRHHFRSDLFMTGNPTPTAVIAAGRDTVVPPTRTQALAAVVDNLVFNRILPDASHAIPRYDPVFAETLLDALAAVERAARDRRPAAVPLPPATPEAQPSATAG